MNRLLVFLKYPEPGKVKTRLCPPYSIGEAADFYRAMMVDSVESYRALPGVEVELQVSPAGRLDEFSTLFPWPMSLRLQAPGDLGRRMSQAFKTAFEEGVEKAVAIGTDHPSLDPAWILRAFDLLEGPLDLSLGPAQDGGYYLLGARAHHAGLFEGMHWSTPRVYSSTLERARDLGLRVRETPPWYDVDQPQDVARLKKDLALGLCAAPRTKRCLGLASPPQ